MIKILSQSTEEILAIKISGTLTHDDYEDFIPLLDAKIQDGDHIYLLADITEFKGMTAHAVMDDFFASVKYWPNFEAVAVVGTKSWEKMLTTFGNYLSPAHAKYFEASEMPQAWRWLEDELSD